MARSPFLRALVPFALLAASAVPAACGSSATSGTNGSGPSDGTPPSLDGGTVDPGTSESEKDGGPSGTAGDAGSTGSKIKTVFVIMMENHSWATIKKAGKSATYINETLVPMGAHAEQYFTPTSNHPSEPNYIWLEAGDALGIDNDNAPADNHQSTKDHLVSQLEAKGISWKAYAEDISGDDCPLTTVGSSYDPKHTPQLYFDDVTDTNDANSQHCKDHLRPFTELAGDLTANKVARYNFITPNLCDDMHGEISLKCNAVSTDLIKKGDDWLKAQIPGILASAAYKDGGAVFVMWDEGDESPGHSASDGPIPFIVLSPFAKTNYSTSTKFTHSSMLRTLQTIFDVPYLRAAKTSNDLFEMFTSH
jgi:phospholipase C